MNFERMTDDELKRFLLLGTTDLDAAVATQEAARRWLSYEQQDVDTVAEDRYDEGYTNGYRDGSLDKVEKNVL